MSNALTTPHLADACVRLGIELRATSIRPAFGAPALSGPAVPVQHLGSVDAMLAALETCGPGAVLVIDDAGRTDRACVGDLLAIEAHHAGVAG
ncbi:MAG: RraA family protein, partial [Actinomycetota bacterium]